MTEYHALTIWQPWASLIAMGAKPYEFRSWKPPKWIVGKRIAIHAGARAMKVSEVRAVLFGINRIAGFTNPCLVADIALPLLAGVRAAQEAEKSPLFERPANAVTLPLSVILGTAIVGEGKRGDLCAAEFGGDAGNDSDRDGTFNWGWPLTDFQHLEPPLHAKGMQGIWKVTL